MEHGISMAMHMAGNPVTLFSSIHCAAATEKGGGGGGGGGGGLNEEAIKAQLKDPAKYFAPTPEWNDERAWDRLWSGVTPGGPPRA